VWPPRDEVKATAGQASRLRASRRYTSPTSVAGLTVDVLGAWRRWDPDQLRAVGGGGGGSGRSGMVGDDGGWEAAMAEPNPRKLRHWFHGSFF
jgi:hypothetical protein